MQLLRIWFIFGARARSGMLKNRRDGGGSGINGLRAHLKILYSFFPKRTVKEVLLFQGSIQTYFECIKTIFCLDLDSSRKQIISQTLEKGLADISSLLNKDFVRATDQVTQTVPTIH